MFQLDVNTWIRFGVWVFIGYVIYFTYGIKNSTEGSRLAEIKLERKIAKATQGAQNEMATIPNEKQYSKDKYVISAQKP